MKSISRRSALTLALSSGIASFGAGSASASPARNVDATLERLRHRVHGSSDLIRRAFGVLVFPTVIKAGIGIGAEYGEGALLEDGRTSGYYNLVSGSVGLQLGGQRRVQVIVFMDPAALARFKASDGWKAGVDGSVVLVEFGASGKADTQQLNQPILGFILGEQGLMVSTSFEGAKITRLQK